MYMYIWQKNPDTTMRALGQWALSPRAKPYPPHRKLRARKRSVRCRRLQQKVTVPCVRIYVRIHSKQTNKTKNASCDSICFIDAGNGCLVPEPTLGSVCTKKKCHALSIETQGPRQTDRQTDRTPAINSFCYYQENILIYIQAYILSLKNPGAVLNGG